MTFTRIPILGSTGILLLQLMACSANDLARRGSGAQNERVNANSVGTDTDPDRADSGQQTDEESESPCAEPFELEKLKWLNQLEKPRVFKPSVGSDENGNRRDEYTIRVRETQVQMLPKGCPTTTVFAYGGSTLKDDGTEPSDTWSSPGATFEMRRGTPARVTWINEITTPHLLPVDATLHWANPRGLPAPMGPFGENFPLDPMVQS
ncbi:MAG TPA: hypothetical protein VGC79_25585, partial [Polyangiaceae bacterium]